MNEPINTNLPPWHDLSVVNSGDLKKTLHDLTLNARMETAPLTTLLGGSTFDVKSHRSLIREDGKVYGVCGPKYVPVQNEDVLKFFVDFCESSGATLERIGTFQQGKIIWGLARTGHEFTLPGNDKTTPYVMFSHPHVWGKALTIKMTTVRIVCWNTFVQALRESCGKAFHMPHIKEFDAEQVKKANGILKGFSNAFVDYQDDATRLAETPADLRDRAWFAASLFQPALIDKAVKPHRSKIDAAKLTGVAAKVYDAVVTQPGATMASAKDTWWGLYNAASYVLDHVGSKVRERRVQNALMGPAVGMKQRAFDLAVEVATSRK